MVDLALKYRGITKQVSSIEVDSAENDRCDVVFDADHESGLGFWNFAMLGELWPKNYFSPHERYNY
jgi:hypothetical protein